MKPEALALRCVEAINVVTLSGGSATDARVLLVLPKGWKPPPRFPRGKTAQWKDDGSRVAYFSAFNVLAWLTAAGFCRIQGEGGQ